MDFDPDLHDDKTVRLKMQLPLLVETMERRLEDYSESRADDHWKHDHAHWHVEKAMGELSMAYAESKDGDDTDVMRREVADAVNHLLMALDIGAGHVELDEKGRRVDDQSNTGG